MKPTGKIMEVLPTQAGEGKNGIWKKKQVIREQILKGFEDIKATATGIPESRQNSMRRYTELKAWKFMLSGLFLTVSFLGCTDDGSSQKAYFGEWNKLESSYFVNRWVFTESDGKLHARHIKQRVEKYKGIESDYACDIDKKGNLVIHTGIDIKGNISDGKLYLMGEAYEKLK